MSKQTIQIGGIAIVVLVGIAAVWQFVSVENLGSEPAADIKPIDYTPLEAAVSIWQEKQPFSMAGSPLAPQVDGPEEATGDEDEDVVISIVVQYAAGHAAAAEEVQSALLELENLEVSVAEVSDEFENTSMTYSESASTLRINEIAGVLTPLYGAVTRNVVSQAADDEVIIRLSSSEEQ